VLIFGILAMGFNLLYGYTGLFSLRHAAYYGLAPTAGHRAAKTSTVGSLWLAGSARGSCIAGLGWPSLGLFCMRRAGPSTSAMMCDHGHSRKILPTFIGFHLADVIRAARRDARNPTRSRWPRALALLDRDHHCFYYFAYVLVGWRCWRSGHLDSPFGSGAAAGHTREKQRAVAAGTTYDRVKHLSFVFSRRFAGLAGSLTRAAYPPCDGRSLLEPLGPGES